MKLKLRIAGKVVAELDRATRTLEKRIVGSKHMLQVPPAIAIDASLYDAYRRLFDFIKVLDKETGCVYECSADHFDKWRILIDRGFGRQYALPLRKWVCHDPSIGQQLELFEEVMLDV